MNETDNPLKRLVHTSIVDFAEWLLGGTVESVRTANIELPTDPDPIKADQLFWVTLKDENEDDTKTKDEVLFHIEFQGKSSHKPMWLRQLDYLSRIVDRERRIRLQSVVFYIGQGVGEKDTGHHEIYGADGDVTLLWHYDVVHLWKLTPEELLELKRPGLLPLIGQTNITNPDETIPKVIEKIKNVPEEETQHRLLTELLALLTDERIIEMVENLIEQDEMFMDTPFMRRLRLRGLEEGRQEGLEEGRQEGLEEGRQEGERAGRRRSILDFAVLRYNPPVSDYLQVEKALLRVSSSDQLADIFKAVLTVNDFPAFATVVDQFVNGNNNEGEIYH